MKNVVGFPDTEAIRKEAAGWIARLDGDDPLSAKERDELRRWIRRGSAHRQALRDAAELWGNLNILTELAPEPVETETNIGVTTRDAAAGRSKRKLFAAAASFAVFLITGAIWLRPDPQLDSNGYYATAVGDQRTVDLADGSVIELNTDTQIKVEYSNNERNITLLQGEAHFVVARIENVPFQVNAGPGQVLAVGTAFAVYLRDEAVDVTVTEGRVSVNAVSRRTATGANRGVTTTVMDSVTLDAGQVATIKDPPPGEGAHSGKIVELQTLTDRELSQRLLWKDGVMVFSRAPLRDVVAEVRRYTTLDIQILDPAVAEKPVIARIPIGDAETMLDVFENNFGLAVTYAGPNRVLLTAKQGAESE